MKPSHFSSLDPSHATRLSKVVRTRDLGLLHEYGGVNGILRALNSDLENGIPGDADDINARREIFGSNFAPVLSTGAKLRQNAFIIGLLFSILISLFPRIILEEVLAVSIAWVMVKFWPYTHLNCLAINCHLDYDPRVDVVRKCVWLKIPISGIVVGDVVFLKPGDQVPADGLFINGHSFHLETVAHGIQAVGEKNPFIYCGDMVADGYCRMVVTAVGVIGENQPPEQRDAHDLNVIIDSACKAFVLSAFMWLGLRLWIDEKGEDIGVALVGMFSASATMVFGSSSRERLGLTFFSLDEVLVRRPAICHQLASVDTICFNKTGTLTSDSYEVKNFWIGFSAIEEVPPNSIARSLLELLHQTIGLSATQPRLSSTFTPFLSCTEHATHKWARSHLGMETESLERSCTIIETEPFSPGNRKSGVLISKNNAIHLHRKGAVDSILPMCSLYYESTGTVKVINSTTRALLQQIVTRMEKDGLRCMAFAHRKTSIQEYFSVTNQTLTLLGLVGLKNSISSGVIRALEDCQRAGIDIKLLTGDSTLTAEFIALRCGLLDSDIKQGQVVEGKEFSNFTGEERMKKASQIRVLARASALDKIRMVQTLRQNGRVVAYVGGGQGDVQALEEADVGICFGIENGAEILKGCSDIVIKEKKFSRIIDVLKWGRGFCGGKKLLIFLLTATIVHLVISLMMIIFNANTANSRGKVPITPVFQLLSVKLILGLVAALFVVIKQPTDDLMSMPPRDPNKPLMSGQAFYQTLVLLVIYFIGTPLFNLIPSEKNTATFIFFVDCHFVVVLMSDKYDLKNILLRKWLWGFTAIIISIKVMMEKVWDNISGERLDASQWTLCIFLAAASTSICQFLSHTAPVKTLS